MFGARFVHVFLWASFAMPIYAQVAGSLTGKVVDPSGHQKKPHSRCIAAHFFAAKVLAQWRGVYLA